MLPKHWESLEGTITSIDSYKDFIGENKKSNYLPSNNQIFEALGALGKPEKCTVVFLGQAPFNKSEWASGFSYCDNSATNWRLQNIRGSTRNLIKAALLDKGYINKQDDIENIQEVLHEIDLPSDNVKDWFMSTAKQGVLWLNMSLTSSTEDSAQERAIHESFWSPIVSEIIRMIFYAKVESTKQDGLVFVLLGKHFSEFKKVIQNLHSDIMGAVPIQIIEGSSPVLETFLNTNYFKSINKDLEELESSVIDWWKPKPDNDYEQSEDEEEDQANEEDNEEEDQVIQNIKTKVHSPDSSSSSKSNGVLPSEAILPAENINVLDMNSVLKLKPSSPVSTPTKNNVNNNNNNNNSQQSLSSSPTTTTTTTTKHVCDLIMEDGSIVQLEEDQEVTLGRNLLPAEIKDKAVSRNQAKITFKKSMGVYSCELVPLGQNPMTQMIDNEPNNLQINVPVFLEDGDIFYLVSSKYPMKIRFPKGISGSKNVQSTPIKQSQSQSQSQPKQQSQSQSQSQSSQKNTTTIGNKRKNDSDNEEKPKKPAAPNKKKAAAKKKKQEPKDMDEDDYDFYDDSDEDYIPPDDSDEEWDGNGSPPQKHMHTRADDKPMCKYGSSCYRKNPEHLKEFRHPKK